jgi:hypothetical protein
LDGDTMDVSIDGSATWRARLRFRLQRKLSIKATEHRLRVAGREVVLAAQERDARISDSSWLVMNTRGFLSRGEAEHFGRKLKAALEISAVAARVGVDTGRDLATSALGQAVRDNIRRQTGSDLRPNVHGLDVFPDDPNARIFVMNGTATLCVSPDPFLGDLDEFHRTAIVPSQRMADVILLMNYSLMQPEPVSQIVFAVSAVESLGQNETWTSDQRALLHELATSAELSATGTDQERREVADVIRKSLHRLTLRQGVFRLLDRLDLAHLKAPWDGLYAERSTLVHGLAPRPGMDYGTLAHCTVGLCGQILLKAIASEIPAASRHIARFYAG